MCINEPCTFISSACRHRVRLGTIIAYVYRKMVIINPSSDSHRRHRHIRLYFYIYFSFSVTDPLGHWDSTAGIQCARKNNFFHLFSNVWLLIKIQTVYTYTDIYTYIFKHILLETRSKDLASILCIDIV